MSSSIWSLGLIDFTFYIALESIHLATFILLWVFMILYFFWFSFYLNTMAFSFSFSFIGSFFLVNLNVELSQVLVPRPLFSLNYYLHSISCTQPNLMQTYMPLIPKFLIPLMTFFLNSRLSYPSSTCLTT